jgi:hypothetical protein
MTVYPPRMGRNYASAAPSVTNASSGTTGLASTWIVESLLAAGETGPSSKADDEQPTHN